MSNLFAMSQSPQIPDKQQVPRQQQAQQQQAELPFSEVRSTCDNTLSPTLPLVRTRIGADADQALDDDIDMDIESTKANNLMQPHFHSHENDSSSSSSKTAHGDRSRLSPTAQQLDAKSQGHETFYKTGLQDFKVRMSAVHDNNVYHGYSHEKEPPLPLNRHGKMSTPGYLIRGSADANIDRPYSPPLYSPDDDDDDRASNESFTLTAPAQTATDQLRAEWEALQRRYEFESKKILDEIVELKSRRCCGTCGGHLPETIQDMPLYSQYLPDGCLQGSHSYSPSECKIPESGFSGCSISEPGPCSPLPAYDPNIKFWFPSNPYGSEFDILRAEWEHLRHLHECGTRRILNDLSRFGDRRLLIRSGGVPGQDIIESRSSSRQQRARYEGIQLPTPSAIANTTSTAPPQLRRLSDTNQSRSRTIQGGGSSASGSGSGVCRHRPSNIPNTPRVPVPAPAPSAGASGSGGGSQAGGDAMTIGRPKKRDWNDVVPTDQQDLDSQVFKQTTRRVRRQESQLPSLFLKPLRLSQPPVVGTLRCSQIQDPHRQVQQQQQGEGAQEGAAQEHVVGSESGDGSDNAGGGDGGENEQTNRQKTEGGENEDDDL